jgi:hypothetical protein
VPEGVWLDKKDLKQFEKPKRSRVVKKAPTVMEKERERRRREKEDEERRNKPSRFRRLPKEPGTSWYLDLYSIPNPKPSTTSDVLKEASFPDAVDANSSHFGQTDASGAAPSMGETEDLFPTCQQPPSQENQVLFSTDAQPMEETEDLFATQEQAGVVNLTRVEYGDRSDVSDVIVDLTVSKKSLYPCKTNPCTNSVSTSGFQDGNFRHILDGVSCFVLQTHDTAVGHGIEVGGNRII